MLMEKERELIADYGRKMSMAGLSHGTAGNLSIFDKESGWMAISPSGVDYFEINAEDIVVLDLEGNVVEGKYKPSSEYNLHGSFYKEKMDMGCRAIVHTHSDYATNLSCMGEPIRAIHYVIASAGTDLIPLCPYTTFGTPELAKLAVDTCKEGRAVLLANHGLVAFGANLSKAFSLASNLEYLAKLQWQCMCAGKMNVLSREQIEKVMQRFRTYGQSTAEPGTINSY